MEHAHLLLGLPKKRKAPPATLAPTPTHFADMGVRMTDWNNVQDAYRGMSNEHWAQWRGNADERLSETGWTPSYDAAGQRRARAEANARWEHHREFFGMA